MKLKTIYIILIGLVIFLASCTTTTRRLDEEPDVCTTSEKNRIINNLRRDWTDEQEEYFDAREDWLDDHNDTLEGFDLTAPAGFVVPTGFDVTTHVLVYKGPGTSRLFRNQSFDIVIDPIDEGATQTVRTVDAKASAQLRHSFTSLNEVEIRVTPVVNASYITTTQRIRKFIPCQDTWFIRIPYELQKNASSVAEELDVPILVIHGSDGFGIKVTNPQPVSPGEVLVLDFELKSGSKDKVAVIEYPADQIQRVRIEKDGVILPRVDMPITNETLIRLGNKEIAYGPLEEKGTYELLIFADETVQPVDRMQIKIFKDDELDQAGDVYFAAKAFNVRDLVSNEDTRIGIVTIIIVLLLLYYGGMLNGKKKR